MASDKLHAGVLIRTDGTSSEMAVSFELAREIIGGYLEPVRLPAGSDVLLVDEDGWSKGLEPNGAASRLAGRPIVGPAIMCSRRIL